MLCLVLLQHHHTGSIVMFCRSSGTNNGGGWSLSNTRACPSNHAVDISGFSTRVNMRQHPPANRVGQHHEPNSPVQKQPSDLSAIKRVRRLGTCSCLCSLNPGTDASMAPLLLLVQMSGAKKSASCTLRSLISTISTRAEARQAPLFTARNASLRELVDALEPNAWLLSCTWQSTLHPQCQSYASTSKSNVRISHIACRLDSRLG